MTVRRSGFGSRRTAAKILARDCESCRCELVQEGMTEALADPTPLPRVDPET